MSVTLMLCISVLLGLPASIVMMKQAYDDGDMKRGFFGLCMFTFVIVSGQLLLEGFGVL